MAKKKKSYLYDKVEEISTISKTSIKEQILVRCPSCPWKAGLRDELHYCDTCLGSGQVLADPLE